MQYQHVTHDAFPEFYDAESRILILGSIPSPKSRETHFYYGHPQNRFWKVLAAVLGEPVPESIEEKKKLLRKYHIALWDSLAECDIAGAGDSTIRNPVPNDIAPLLLKTRIKAVYCTGRAAYRYYEKYCFPAAKIHAVLLPSTSAANAAFSLDALTEAYRVIQSGLSEEKAEKDGSGRLLEKQDGESYTVKR